jgi:hypothetical protein
MAIKNPYKRIAKRRVFAAGYSLWINSEFLLAISSGPFAENYKRFYFQNIKSILLYKSEAWKIWNWVLGGCGVCSALIMLMAPGKGTVFLGALTISAVVALIVNNGLGPSCVCYIETGVQKEKLNALNRIKKAQKAMDTLKPLIMQVQNKMPATGRLNSNL